VVTRYAFTMIELIFAIVIIGISVLSLPMMSQVTSKSIEGNLVQEAIFAASTELNQVTSYYWDENSIEGNNLLTRVVWTANNDCDTNTKLRTGHINQPYHRRCRDDDTARPTLQANFGPEAGDLDDLDDLQHGASTIYIGDATTNKGYKENYNSSIIVTSPADLNGTLDVDIKRIRIIISNAGENVVQLDTFSCNIGEIDYYKRTY